jgi:hypothetical protein
MHTPVQTESVIFMYFLCNFAVIYAYKDHTLLRFFPIKTTDKRHFSGRKTYNDKDYHRTT